MKVVDEDWGIFCKSLKVVSFIKGNMRGDWCLFVYSFGGGVGELIVELFVFYFGVILTLNKLLKEILYEWKIFGYKIYYVIFRGSRKIFFYKKW